MKQIKNYNPNQTYLINFNPNEFFSKNSLEWVINDIIEEHISLKPFLDKMKNLEKGKNKNIPA